MNARTISTILVAGAVLMGCAYLAEETAPKKQPAAARSAAAIKADTLFWTTLHGGDYENIQPALEALTAAYLDTPNDAVTAAHIAWLHFWRITERARLDRVPAAITDDVVMARKYFGEAVALNPTDARYLGFLGSATVIEGRIHHEEQLVRRGYYTLLDSIRAWPEFNLFTGGYTLSALPAGSHRFQEGLAWQWRTLDVCIQGKLDRQNPDYSRYMSLQTTTGKKRVCWNSWIAPHNLEGFFLNMGDMLVKSGDWQTAQKIYANARLSPDYATWPFRAVLEERIGTAENNVALFNAPPGKAANRGAAIMVNSQFACMGCHQQ